MPIFQKTGAKVQKNFDIRKFFLHMSEKNRTFAQFLIYGTTIIVFIRCDGGQFSVFRAGIGTDVHIA